MPATPPLDTIAELYEYNNDWIRNDATPAFQSLRMNTLLHEIIRNQSTIISTGGGEPTIPLGTTAQYWRGDKTWQILNNTAVGLGNVPNINATIASNLSSGTIPVGRYGSGTIPISAISATGTPSAGTVLFGNGTWGAPVQPDGDRGDITVSGSGTIWTIDNSVINFAKFQDISSNRILGRILPNPGVIAELTGADITQLLSVFSAGLQGLVPASGGGTANFLQADGTWAAPPVTNLSFSQTASTLMVLSSTGTDAVLPAATTINAGVMSAADKVKVERTPRVFNVVTDYGADPTFVADATMAIQNAINAAFAAGGGIVFFPYGHYKIDGALVTLVDGVNPNCQLYLPLSTGGTSVYPKITFRGESPSNWSAEVVTSLPKNQYGVILESTILSPGYVFGSSFYTSAGLGGEVNYTWWGFEHIEIRTRTQTAGVEVTPVMSGINSNAPRSVHFDHVKVTTQSPELDLLVPANTWGVLLPHYNNNGNITINNLNIGGYYNGFRAAEHMSVTYVNTYTCVNGMVVPFMNHSGTILHFSSEGCKNHIMVEGAMYVHIGTYNVEHYTTAGAWNMYEYDVKFSVVSTNAKILIDLAHTTESFVGVVTLFNTNAADGKVIVGFHATTNYLTQDGTGNTNVRWNNTQKAFQFGAATGSSWLSQTGGLDAGLNSVVLGDTTDLHLNSNAFFDGAWKYFTNAPAANMYLYNGDIIFRTAGAGAANAAITWAEKFKIANNGSLLFGGSAGTTGQFLTSQGVGSAPTWTTFTSSGVTTMGAIGAAPNANGATISGNTLTLQPASASFGGVVTTGAQTFAGDKTISGNFYSTGIVWGGLNGGAATGIVGEGIAYGGEMKSASVPLLISNTSTTAGLVTAINNFRSGVFAGTANDGLRMTYQTRNSASGLVTFANVDAIMPIATAASETGRLDFSLLNGAGSVALSLQINPDGILIPTTYINFGNVYGLTGYGLRDNAGIIQFKNSGGVWAAFGSGGGDALTTNPLSQFAATTSAQFAGVITDEIGTGKVLLSNIVTNAQTASYTLVLTDEGKLIQQNVATANNLTVPTNATVAFPVGTQITIVSIGAGQVTIVPAAGVTINSAGGALKLRVQYSSGTLIKTATDTWLLVGDIIV